MKIKIFILLLLSVIKINSQIKIDFSLNSNKNKAKINIINETNEYLIIPLDIASLRPYYNNICLDMKEHEYPYPTLGFNILLKQGDSIIESSANSEIPNDTILIKKEFNKQTLKRNDNIKKISSWKRKNHFETFEKAKMNFYVFNNLLYLKPRQVLSFNFIFNLDNITNQKYFHSYYSMNNYNKYSLCIFYEVQQCVYDYLSSSQIDMLKKYKFFTGKIESNRIEW